MKKYSLCALVCSVALALSACSGAGSESTASSASSMPSATAAPSSPAPSESPKVNLPDPRSLTGLSEVTGIADPTPIEGHYEQKLPVTVTDFEGNKVEVKDTSRVLALDINGTLSRTIIALGYGKSLVGRTVSSTENQLKDLPVVTENGHSLNVEAILALKPTLILADRSVGPPEALNQLRASGVPVVLVNPKRSIASTGELIKTVAHVFGVDAAGTALAERTDKEIAAAKAQIAKWVPANPLKVAFLYVRGTAGVFFILGSDEGTPELIKGVGAVDVAEQQGITATSPANAEALVKLNPEVIFVMSEGLKSTDGLKGLLARPGVAETIAGQKQRVIAIPDGLSLSFGPQTGDVLLAVAKALYGVK